RVVSMKIGVYGGTFDPVHIGHMAVAVNVRHVLHLDRLLMVVANVPWQKAGGREVSPSDDRLAMVEAAVEGLSGVEASPIELDRGGSSYTADTLATLSEMHPGAEVFCVVGDDVAAKIEPRDRVVAV